jgi:hypothetical protein
LNSGLHDESPETNSLGHGTDPVVKERAELYLFSSSEPSWPLLGWTLQYLLFFKIWIQFLSK